MSTKPPLVARWGGPPPAHNPLVLTPASKHSDLVLSSEVLEQGFLSLQQHQYAYKAENGFLAGGAGSAMNIKWSGPAIDFERASPGVSAVSSQSFFSAQVMKTTATAEVIAGSSPVAARMAVDERADAYVPWTKAIGDPVMKAVRALVKSGVSAANAASFISSSGESLSISSELEWANEMFTYRIRFKNGGAGPLRVAVEGVRFDYAIDLYMEAGEDAEYELALEDQPEESQAWVIISDVCRFPIRVLAAERMTERVMATQEVPAGG